MSIEDDALEHAFTWAKGKVPDVPWTPAGAKNVREGEIVAVFSHGQYHRGVVKMLGHVETRRQGQALVAFVKTEPAKMLHLKWARYLYRDLG